MFCLKVNLIERFDGCILIYSVGWCLVNIKEYKVMWIPLVGIMEAAITKPGKL